MLRDFLSNERYEMILLTMFLIDNCYTHTSRDIDKLRGCRDYKVNDQFGVLQEFSIRVYALHVVFHYFVSHFPKALNGRL